MSDRTELEVLSHSEGETEEVGRAIGLAGRGGELVGLVGELGAGKTRLVKGIALGLGLEPREVRSPTFVLIREHQGRLRLYHVDAYRLAGAADLDSLGFAEMVRQGGLTVVEWADHVAESLPEDRLTVQMTIVGPGSRRIRVSSGGEQSQRLLERLRGRRRQQMGRDQGVR